MTEEKLIADVFADHERVVRDTAALSPLIAEAAALISAAFRSGGGLLVCGNGGSAADSQHVAAEFSGRFLKEREPWPAQALTVNTSVLTAVGNDYGFDEVFARQVRAFGKPGDVLIAISTSGTSPNVLRAAEAASERGMRTIALTGAGGGELAGADVCLAVPSTSTPRIQEAHVLVLHLVCQLVEDSLC